MTTIVGFGNSLRGDDSFGIDCIKALKKEIKSNKVNLFTKQQLLPELCLDLLDSKKIVFIDASYDEEKDYILACKLKQQTINALTHHISPHTIIYTMKNLFYKEFEYEIYSMYCNSFDKIKDEKKYKECVESVVSFLKTNY